MGTIKINSKTNASLYINDTSVGKIRKGINQYQVEDEECEIYAKLAWCESQRILIAVENNEIKMFSLKSFMNEGLIGGLLMSCVGLFVVTKFMVFAILFGLILLYPLYYLFINQKEYLDLKSES